MLYTVHIRGTRPIIHNNGQGVDKTLPAVIEKKTITDQRHRTAADDARVALLDCRIALWLDYNGQPTIPAAAIRASIERAARKSKEGPLVREGLTVDEVLGFDYDTGRYGTALADWEVKTQFSTGVVIGRQRVMKTRAMFDMPWEYRFNLDCDEELIEKEKHLLKWLDISGRRIGLGDWRPEKSGDYGRYEVVSIDAA